GRGIRRAPSRHVTSDARQRDCQGPQHSAVREPLFVAPRHLRRMERAEALGGFFQGGADARSAARLERLPLARCDEWVCQVGSVEAERQLAQRVVPSVADVGDRAGNGSSDVRGRSCRRAQERRLRAAVAILEVEEADHAAPPRRSRTGSNSSSFSRYEARFTTRRAVTWSRSSTTARPFCSSVRPVSTRSTIASARFATAASSTDPDSRTTSTGTARRAKARAVRRGYFVATRNERPTSAPLSPV